MKNYYLISKINTFIRTLTSLMSKNKQMFIRSYITY